MIMPHHIEVCIDNIESLRYAEQGGATRIELCSSLALGGLTPSIGLITRALRQTHLPIYAMIRPRQGDFLYQSHDIEVMLEDIYHAKQAGVAGVVFGVLNKQGAIDMPSAKALMTEARGIGVTFHRAIDQCSDYVQGVENIAELGCERILTSGQAADAYQGRDRLADMVKRVNRRFAVMAGAGINAGNISEILTTSGVSEVHLSAKSTRLSEMATRDFQAKMGNIANDDMQIPVTDPDKLRAVVTAVEAKANQRI